MTMRAEVETVRLRPKGTLGRWAMAVTRGLPASLQRKAARLCWRLGLLEQS